MIQKKFFLIHIILILSTLCQAQTYFNDTKTKLEPNQNIKADFIKNEAFFLVFKPLTFKKEELQYFNKKEKGRYVYNRLVEFNQQQMNEVKLLLHEQNIHFQILDVCNAIYFRTNDLSFLAKLSSFETIQKIVQDFEVHNENQYYKESSPSQRAISWGLQLTGIKALHDEGFLGEGAVIGNNDTGVDYLHDALFSSYRGNSPQNIDHNYNWHDAIHEKSVINPSTLENPCGYNLIHPCDDDNHGTHTAGTASGMVTNDTFGVAPKAKWIGTRNMESGYGSLSGYIEAINWYLAPTDTNNLHPNPDKSPDVINNSWYCSIEEGCNINNWELLLIALKNIRAAGIVFVASAGNSGPECETIAFVPGLSPDAFTVGAIAQNDTIASYSSRGFVTIDQSNRIKPDVVAPGSKVLSSIPGNKYALFSGTSMASPHVTGLVALMIGANPLLAGQVDTIEAIIRSTAVQKFSNQNCSKTDSLSFPNPTNGYGRIDAYRAVHEALNFKLIANNQLEIDKNITLYPNPGKGQLTIANPTSEEILEIKVYDINGRLASHHKNHETSHIVLNFNNLKNGVYLVMIATRKAVIAKKWVNLNVY